jgi:hypothetical protein
MIVAALQQAELAVYVGGVASVGRIEIGVGGCGEIRATSEGGGRRQDEQESEKDCGEDASDAADHGCNS